MPSALDTLRLPRAQLPALLEVPVVGERAKGGAAEFELRAPGSKSLTNRALLLAGLATGESIITNALVDADDAARMVEALRLLGAWIGIHQGEVRVRGAGGRLKAPGQALFLNNAGTATRFLAAAALLADGPVTIDGNERMRERPIAELGDALIQLGCGVEYVGGAGCPPIRITPPASLPVGATITVGRTASSQFVSALLLTGIFLPHGLTIKISAEPTSASYIRMTLWLLSRLGVSVRTSDDLRVLRVQSELPGARGMAGFTHDVEPDASSATPLWGAAAVLPGVTCRVRGLSFASAQGDAKVAQALGRMGAEVVEEPAGSGGGGAGSIGVTGPGALQPLLADLSDMPDAAMSLAAVACFAEGTTILRGLRTLRVKETDRIEAIRRELTKVGVRVENPVRGDDGAMTITPRAGGIDCSAGAPRIEFETYDDHRMAMSLAIVGLRRPNTFIRSPRCVEKTYPGFWADLAEFIRAAKGG